MAKSKKIETPDPLVTTVQETHTGDTDIAAHIRTYNSVVKGAQWFVIHALLMLVGLYVIIFAHSMGWGMLIIAFAVALLIYGLSRPPAIKRDAERALSGARSAENV